MKFETIEWRGTVYLINHKNKIALTPCLVDESKECFKRLDARGRIPPQKTFWDRLLHSPGKYQDHSGAGR